MTRTPTSIVVAVTVIFTVTIGGVVTLAITGSAEAIAPVMGSLAPTLGILLVMGRVGTIETKVDEANKALNGAMDEKIARNVSETLNRHGVPEVPEPRIGD